MSKIFLKPFDSYNINRNAQFLKEIEYNIEGLSFGLIGKDIYLTIKRMNVVFKNDYSMVVDNTVMAVVEENFIHKITDFNTSMFNNILVLRFGQDLQLLYNMVDFKKDKNDIILGYYNSGAFHQLVNIKRKV